MNKNFECTICLDTAKEPVLTKCGHIYCWPCIYNWLDSKGGRAKCPNCKNEITKNDLIPVYANDENKENTNRFKNIPKRPKAERNPNTERENFQGSFSNFSFNFGGGFFPFMMNFNNMGNQFNSDYQDYTQQNNYNSQNNNNYQEGRNGFLQGVPENTKQAIINLMILLFFLLLFLIQ
jgi:E3 ubiquitin-protein ligase RNF5